MNPDNLVFFSSDSKKSSLPFYDDWRKKQNFKENKYYVVTDIRLVKSNKGYMVQTTDFAVFLWSNSSLCKMIIEALKAYISRPEEGYELIIVVDKDKAKEYKIAANKEKKVSYFYSKKIEAYSITEFESDSEESSTNPLL